MPRHQPEYTESDLMALAARDGLDPMLYNRAGPLAARWECPRGMWFFWLVAADEDYSGKPRWRSVGPRKEYSNDGSLLNAFANAQRIEGELAPRSA